MACAWDICRALWLDPADLAKVARRRLSLLATHARKHSPFYRERLARFPDEGPVQLQEIPVLDKRTLMSEFDRVLTDDTVRQDALRGFLADPQQVGRPFGQGCAVWTSSGTSGEPGIFVHDPQALAVYDALQLFRFRGASATWTGAVAPLAMGRYALVAATGGHFAGAASVERLRLLFPWLAPMMRVISLMQPLPALVAELNKYAPDVIATYPTMAVQLAREQEAGRLAIAPTQIWTGGETLSPLSRELLECVFGATVREEYGTSEFPSVAVGCSAGWLHVNADWVLLEPVDERFRPVEPGRPSHSVLLTNLANRLQPLIRYDLGDCVTVRPGICECGSRLPAIRVQGRRDEPLELRAPSGKAVALLPLALTTVLEEGAGLYDFQLVQTGARRLCLHVGTAQADRAEPARQALASYLARMGLDAVHIEFGSALPQRSAGGGKLRRVLRASQAGRSRPDRGSAQQHDLNPGEENAPGPIDGTA
jgi:phenylacetate-coenzyme A ligase PaaK-like adenylate-forming protein